MLKIVFKLKLKLRRCPKWTIKLPKNSEALNSTGLTMLRSQQSDLEEMVETYEIESEELYMVFKKTKPCIKQEYFEGILHTVRSPL